MDQGLLKVFQAISGWRTPEEFGHENDGYVTFEEDRKTHCRSAFFWKADYSHEHLNAMWLGGQTFVRRAALVALALFLPFSTQADPARDEFVREVTVTLIKNQASWLDVTNHVKQSMDGWNEYQRLVEEKQ
jgi:hypothetical protein